MPINRRPRPRDTRSALAGDVPAFRRAGSAWPYIPEPREPDDRPGLRRESTWDFLHRSTWDRAVETRAFYNEALRALPEPSRKPILNQLRAGHTQSATFEMLVGRFLQLRSAVQLEHEPESRGRHVDWRASFADGDVYVEAFAPVYNAGSAETASRHDRLLDLLEERIPDGWWLMPFHLPALPGHAPLYPFRRVAESLLAQLPPADSVESDTIVHLRSRLPEGRVEFTAFRTEGRGGLGGGAMITHYDNSQLVLRASWEDRRKRSQGRSVPPPALLAILGGFMGADLDDFEAALLGRDARRGSEPDGAMVRETDPPWAGVLAFPRGGPAGADDPVLFVAPAYRGSMPAAIERLEVRRLVAGGVDVSPSEADDVWAGVRWASMAE